MKITLSLWPVGSISGSEVAVKEGPPPVRQIDNVDDSNEFQFALMQMTLEFCLGI